MGNIKVKLIDFQKALISLKANHLHILNHCGAGAGKTFGGAEKTVETVLGNENIAMTVTAPTYKVMHDATMPKLRTVFENWGLQEGVHWKYLAQDEEIKVMVTNSLLRLRSTEHPEALRGADNACVWMDEPRDSPYVAYTNLVARLRGYEMPKMIWLTSTPAGKSHWLYQVFYGDANIVDRKVIQYLPDVLPMTRTVKRITPDEGSEAIETTFICLPARTRDNPYGGRELDEQLALAYGGRDTPLYRQEALGQFVMLSGMVHAGWDAEKHVVAVDKWPAYPEWRIGGVDFGQAHPCGIEVEGVDRDRRHYIIDEFWKTFMGENEFNLKAWEMCCKHKLRALVCDTEDLRWIISMKRYFAAHPLPYLERGQYFPIVNAKKHLKDTLRNPTSGMGLCNASLNYRLPDESQGFFVNPACLRFQWSIENYVLDERTQMPVRKDDDPVNAWRYAEEFIQDYWGRSFKAESLGVKRAA